jgi:hypothetical protein
MPHWLHKLVTRRYPSPRSQVQLKSIAITVTTWAPPGDGAISENMYLKRGEVIRNTTENNSY